MQESAAPWWKFGHVWLVISGPVIVVFASFVTYYLAASHQDPVLKPEPVQVSGPQDKSVAAANALAPAQQARNHAQTGVALPPAGKP